MIISNPLTENHIKYATRSNENFTSDIEQEQEKHLQTVVSPHKYHTHGKPFDCKASLNRRSRQ